MTLGKGNIPCIETRDKTIEANLGLFDLYTADEIFVTVTLAEIPSLTKLDGRLIKTGKSGNLKK